jgi:hypothetical protein
MMSAPTRSTTGPRRSGRSRCASPGRRNARPANRVAGQKTASGIFFAAPSKTHWENPTQTLGTHQQNLVCGYDFASGCAVAPNSTATTTTGATWGDALSSFGKWVAGTLPTNQGFGPDTGQTQDMMKAPGVQRAIDYFYTKNANNGPDNQQSVENYQAGFGLKGLVQSGLNPTQQFVGNYRVDIYPNANGTLSVQLSNTTSMTSFLYGLGPNWNQSTFAPGGNASQLYYWTQPNKNVPQTGKPGGAGGTW